MQTELVASQWRIFFDGVEVPHQGFNVSFPINSVSSCRIVMEPDEVLARIRPQTVISIWARERYSATPPKTTAIDQLKSEYYLYWEGLTTGVVHSKGTSQRSMAVSGEGFLGVLSRAGGFMLGLGQIPNTSVLTGSRNFIPETSQEADIRTLTLLGTTLKATNSRNMSDVVMTALAFLLSKNGIARLQERRYQVLSRIGVLDDACVTLMLSTLASTQFLNMPQSMPSTSSILDVVRHVQSYVFYRMVSVPAPRPVDIPAEGLTVYAPLEGVGPIKFNTSTDFKSTFRRNEVLSVPDMYYAPPPACNLVLPDMLQGLSVTRDFYTEPTRTVVQDLFTFNGQGLIHLAPPNISPGLGASSAELFSYAVNASVSPEDSADDSTTTSSYRYAKDGGTVSTLEALSTYEIEKGIVLNMAQPDYSAVYAGALYLAAKLEKDAEGGNVDPDGPEVETYKLFVTASTNYQHELARLNRTIQVDMHGHRSMVPGFTAAIFDSDASYLAYVDNLTFSVDPTGRESTQATMSRGRVIPKVNYTQLLEDIDAATQDLLGETVTVASACTVVLNQLTGETEVSDDEDKKLRAAQKVLAQHQTKLYSRLGDIAERYEIPLPPYFLAMGISDGEQLDTIYEQLLGCKPLYASSYAPKTTKGFSSALSGLNKLANSTPSLGGAGWRQEGVRYDVYDPTNLPKGTNLLLESTKNYIRALQTLSNVYQIDTTADRTDAPKNWQEVNQESSIGAGTFEWAHRTFLQRKRVYLDRYLTEHKLSLSILSAPGSNIPGMTPRTFAKMEVAPDLDFVVSPFFGLGTGEVWDNSIFSKLVYDPEYSGTDGEIQRVRDALTSLGGIKKEMLTTQGRQNFILNYSNKHFGSRAFDGS